MEPAGYRIAATDVKLLLVLQVHHREAVAGISLRVEVRHQEGDPILYPRFSPLLQRVPMCPPICHSSLGMSLWVLGAPVGRGGANGG